MVTPCHSCFLFSPFLALFSLQDDKLERGGPLSPLTCPGLQDSIGKTPRVFREKLLCIFTPPRGSLWPLWTVQVWCHGLYLFIIIYFCVNQIDQASFFPLCYPFTDAVLLRESLDPTRAGPRYRAMSVPDGMEGPEDNSGSRASRSSWHPCRRLFQCPSSTPD